MTRSNLKWPNYLYIVTIFFLIKQDVFHAKPIQALKQNMVMKSEHTSWNYFAWVLIDELSGNKIICTQSKLHHFCIFFLFCLFIKLPSPYMITSLILSKCPFLTARPMHFSGLHLYGHIVKRTSQCCSTLLYPRAVYIANFKITINRQGSVTHRHPHALTHFPIESPWSYNYQPVH